MLDPRIRAMQKFTLEEFAHYYSGEQPIYVYREHDFVPDQSLLLFTIKSDMNCSHYLQDRYAWAKVASWYIKDDAVYVGIELYEDDE